MNGKRILKWGLIVAAVLVMLVPVGFVAYFVIGSADEGGVGSMAEAVRLRPVVEAMPEPTRTTSDYQANTVAIVFENGEWVVGVAKNSHGLYSRSKGGGTVVLKDSRGRVRCFFGHVCGGGALGTPQEVGVPGPGIQSLDELDAHLNSMFVEQPWP